MQDTRTVSVFYYSTLPFPDGGMAAGNRIYHLASALASAGGSVSVLSPFSDSGLAECMRIGNVEYRSLCHVPRGRFQWLARRWALFVLFPFRFAMIVRKCRDGRAIYCYGESNVLMAIGFAISRILRCPLAMEGAELPGSVFRNLSWPARLMDRIRLKFFDGVVAITEDLREYYKRACRRDCNVLFVPMTVDFNLFAAECRPSPFEFDYIAYTGSMDRIGGGVDTLVRAFVLFADRNPDMHLVLIGKGNDEIKARLLSLISAEKARRVHFLFSGDIPRLDMPMYVKNASILAMLPAQTKQQEGCFPTKLGEYLSSGVPTVVSKVGIPPRYLEDGVNVVFVPPGDPSGVADRFEYIMAHRAESEKIAEAGARYAKEHFDYRQYGQVIKEYYRELVGK